MRILVAVDENPYSGQAVQEAARLAMNTWADVTLLGVDPKTPTRRNRTPRISGPSRLDPTLAEPLQQYREQFLSHFKDTDSPYVKRVCGYELIEVQAGIWEELYVCRSAKKDLRVRLRLGSPIKQILSESEKGESDLIVLGCNRAKGCLWEDGGALPQKVANEASCSVLVVKERKEIEKVVCCLDHDRVSQQSLEMINQMVTIHRAELVMVGLTEKNGLKAEVERKMDWILRYYMARQIKPWIELVELSSLEPFVSQEAQWGLTALWMGEKSILAKVFSKSKVERLIRASESSVLILR